MCHEGSLKIFVAIVTFLLDLQFFFFCHNVNHGKQILCTSFTFIF